MANTKTGVLRAFVVPLALGLFILLFTFLSFNNRETSFTAVPAVQNATAKHNEFSNNMDWGKSGNDKVIETSHSNFSWGKLANGQNQGEGFQITRNEDAVTVHKRLYLKNYEDQEKHQWEKFNRAIRNLNKDTITNTTGTTDSESARLVMMIHEFFTIVSVWMELRFICIQKALILIVWVME